MSDIFTVKALVAGVGVGGPQSVAGGISAALALASRPSARTITDGSQGRRPANSKRRSKLKSGAA